MKIEIMDLGFMGTEEIIASFLLTGEGSAALVETGPTTCVENLMRGLEGHGVAPEEVEKVLLTHIHLDHSGASGHLAERLPNAVFYVHEVGYPHLVDPSKLLKSAKQLYGDDMDRLWGEMVPVPEENIRALSGGETVEGMRVEYTPGHASHHVSYFDEESGDAYVGDVAGVRIPPAEFVASPTPPPDIDLERWSASLDLIEGRNPALLRLTHFGGYGNVAEHVDQMRGRLAAWGEVAKTADLERFVQVAEAEVRASTPDEETAQCYFQAAPPDQLYLGLDRYWSKKAEREAVG